MVLQDDFDKVANEAGTPEDGIDCHVAVMGCCTMSGFIPVLFIEKLLEDRPDIAGITLLGMRMEAPEMTDEAVRGLEVFAYAPTGVSLFALD